MNVHSTPAVKTLRPAVLLFVLSAVALLLGAAPALAADGVRVIPEPAAGTPAWSQYQPDVSGLFLAYQHNSILPPNDQATIDVKYLGDASAPFGLCGGALAPPAYFHAEPKVLYDVASGYVYVVWTMLQQQDPWDEDIMLWRGTWNGSTFVTDTSGGFPKILVNGDLGGVVAAPTPTWQRHPDIGWVTRSGVSHIVVAWEDSRDYGTDTTRVYYLDLTDNMTQVTSQGWTLLHAATAGTPVSPMPIWARAQSAPTVGQNGIYWLDDRWSWLSPDGPLMDTAVMHADLSGAGNPVVSTLQSDTNHTYDNGEDWFVSGGPVATADGAAWRRIGPYGTSAQIVSKSAGASGSPTVGVTLTDPWDPSAYAGATKTAFAASTRHNNNHDLDFDIAFWDSVTQTKVMVCDVGSTDPTNFRTMQFTPNVSSAPFGIDYGYRVVWCDLRDAAAGSEEDSADARLYQAYVPIVAIKVSKAFAGSYKITATVTPNFAGAKVRAETVGATTKYGATLWTKPHTIGALKALGSTSTATWTWHPLTPGTYSVRVWFAGGTKYDGDYGTTGTLIPHVPAYSKVLRVTVK